MAHYHMSFTDAAMVVQIVWSREVAYGIPETSFEVSTVGRMASIFTDNKQGERRLVEELLYQQYPYEVRDESVRAELVADLRT